MLAIRGPYIYSYSNKVREFVMTVDGTQVGGGGAEDYSGPILERLEETGWESTGSIGATSVGASFYRQQDKLGAGTVETLARLNLLDGQGLQVPGFGVDFDDETDSAVISYDGPRDERFDSFIDDLTVWGEDIESRRNEMLRNGLYVSWAQSIFGQLTANIAKSPIDEITEVEWQSRKAVITDLTHILVPGYVEGLEPQLAIEFLQALFVVIAREQHRLLDDLEGESDVPPEFGVLVAIAQGVQREILMRREIMAVESDRLIDTGEEAIEAADPGTKKFLAELKADSV